MNHLRITATLTAVMAVSFGAPLCWGDEASDKADLARIEKQLAGREKETAKASKELIAMIEGTKRKAGLRIQAIRLLGKCGDRKGLDFLVDHLFLELRAEDNIAYWGHITEDYPCLAAVLEFHEEDWNVIPSILRSLNHPKKQLELSVLGTIIRRIAGRSVGLALVDAELKRGPKGVWKQNLEKVRRSIASVKD